MRDNKFDDFERRMIEAPLMIASKSYAKNELLSKHDFFENLLRESEKKLKGKPDFKKSLKKCLKGEILKKFGHGKSFQNKKVFISKDCSRLCWEDLNKSQIKSFSFSLCGFVRRGVDSYLSKKELRKKVENDKAVKNRIFSIYCSAFRDPICIECKNSEQCDNWIFVIDVCVRLTHLNYNFSEWQSIRSEWDEKPMKKNEIQALLRKFNIGISKREIGAILKKLNASNNSSSFHKISFDVFFEAHLKFTHRKEFLPLFEKYSDTCEKNASLRIMSVTDFQAFLRREQKEKICADIVLKRMIETINNNNEHVALCKQSVYLSKRDFVNYLHSDLNPVVDMKPYELSMNMKLPLSHYYISTSHNTYLENYQCKGRSSVSMYASALILGCRCVEIDCWDGPSGEPVVYHGYSLTMKIPFQSVINEINLHAFKTSEYPLIVSLENHCSPAQQTRMCSMINLAIGGLLAKRSQYDPKTASPEILKNKILIKGSMETSIKELRELIFLRSQKFQKSLIFEDVQRRGSKDENCDIRTFSEKKFQKIKMYGENKFKALSANRLMRCYPSYNRVLSSNYNPMQAWNLGCQMAALNFQTYDKAMIIHNGMFSLNGGCGYVLKLDDRFEKKQSEVFFKKFEKTKIVKQKSFKFFKEEKKQSPKRKPSSFTSSKKEKSPRKSKSVDEKQNTVDFEVEIISASQLPKSKSDKHTSKVINPFVQIDVCGINNAKRRTKTIVENGFNPIWQEKFHFSITKKDFDVGFVVFRVFTESSLKNKNLLASNCFPLCYIQRGYRFVPLKNRCNEPINRCGLYCVLNFVE